MDVHKILVDVSPTVLAIRLFKKIQKSLVSFTSHQC